MLSKAYNTSTVGFERELSVTAKAPDIETLLAAWLRELLVLFGEGFAIGDLLVVEVGQVSSRSYGATGMSVRGTARGRMIGDWFETKGTPTLDVGQVVIVKRRRRYEASVLLGG